MYFFNLLLSSSKENTTSSCAMKWHKTCVFISANTQVLADLVLFNLIPKSSSVKKMLFQFNFVYFSVTTPAIMY